MKIHRGLHNLPSFGTVPDNGSTGHQSSGCVATIGNFDGVHLGHQALLEQLGQKAVELALPSLVITFQPLPHEHFNPATNALRLQSLRDRLLALAAVNPERPIDHVLLLPFNKSLASVSAEAFITDILQHHLQVRHLLIGDDFRFGSGRKGDLALLQRYARPGEFSVSASDTFAVDDDRVSSTRLRKLLGESDLAGVKALTGRHFSISGLVVHGEKVGRQLGFPTANILLKNHRPILRGVFGVKIHGKNLEAFGVANLGERPTVGGRKLLLEVHLLDQDQDLYGQHLSVDFHTHIRNEQKFDSLDALKAAIGNDIETARSYFNIRP